MHISWPASPRQQENPYFVPLCSGWGTTMLCSGGCEVVAVVGGKWAVAISLFPWGFNGANADPLIIINIIFKTLLAFQARLLAWHPKHCFSRWIARSSSISLLETKCWACSISWRDIECTCHHVPSKNQRAKDRRGRSKRG